MEAGGRAAAQSEEKRKEGRARAATKKTKATSLPLAAMSALLAEAAASVRLISSSLTTEYRKTPANLKVRGGGGVWMAERADLFCVFSFARPRKLSPGQGRR